MAEEKKSKDAGTADLSPLRSAASVQELTSPARRPGADYEVGYGKPPKVSQFKPGRSGNPRGRPRGSRNRRHSANEERLKAIVLEEAYRTIDVNDRGKQVTIPMAQAVFRSVAHNAVKGHVRAQKLFTELVGHTERENKRLQDELMEAAIEYKVDWERELLRRRQHGITDLPEPLPHPDDVRIDMRQGTVRFTGPMQKSEVADWAELREMKAGWLEEVALLEVEIAKEADPSTRDGLRDELEHARKMLDMTRKAVPD